VVAQAVSWARAEQTGYWQRGDKVSTSPQIDLDQVDRLVKTIEEHNAAWQTWFEAHGVSPLELTYESVVADPSDAVRRVVEHLDRRLPGDWTPTPQHEQQADSLNADGHGVTSRAAEFHGGSFGDERDDAHVHVAERVRPPPTDGPPVSVWARRACRCR
jgi:hypothetical protein